MKKTKLLAAIAAAAFLGISGAKAQWTGTSPLSTTDNISVSGTSTLTGVTTVGTSGSTSTNLYVNGSTTISNPTAPNLTVIESTSNSANQVNLGIASGWGSYSCVGKTGDAILRIVTNNTATGHPALTTNNFFLTNQTGGNINFSLGTGTGGSICDKVYMQLNANGRLGIGPDYTPTSTTSGATPTTDLDIRTANNEGINLQSSCVGCSATTSTNTKCFMGFSAGNNSQLLWAMGMNLNATSNSPNSGSSYIGSTSNPNDFYIWNSMNTNSTPFYINSLGNVGIGSNNIVTNNALTVNGSAAITGAATIATSTMPSVPSSGGNINSLQFAVAGNANVSSSLIVGGTSSFTATTPFPTGYCIYASSGILAQRVKVAAPSDNTNWSDFVFDKNYKLRSLAEVEKYINKNHHLPEIPSTEEVGKNGIDVAEMDAKLLQKIEELTLYVIEMKKENEKQNAKIEALEKENTSLKK